MYQLQGGLRSSMGYIGAKNLNELNKKAKFVKITKKQVFMKVYFIQCGNDTKNYQL